MGMVTWKGVFPALTTQFTAADEIDWAAMERHVEYLLDTGVHGLVILGPAAEHSSLTVSEKLDTVKFFAGVNRRALPLITVIAECSTRQAREFAVAAEKAGTDGFMLLPPLCYSGDRRETLTYLHDVAAVTSCPIMLANRPMAPGADLTPEDFQRLADNSRFEAIEESSGDTRRLTEIRRQTGDRFSLFCGVDNLALESFAVAAVGWVSGLAGAFPRESVKIWELCLAGRFAEARAVYDWFLPLLHLDTGPKFVQQIKLVEALVGVGSAKVRAPRLQLTEAEASRVEEILANALDKRPEVR